MEKEKTICAGCGKKKRCELLRNSLNGLMEWLCIDCDENVNSDLLKD